MSLLRAKNLWTRLRSSLWLVPSLLTVVAFAGAEIAVRADDWLDLTGEREIPGIYPGSAEGARQVLSTLAGSMISLTTISFSVMMVVLTLASNQFGPRVLRNFLSDRVNQAVLGSFVATFVYCMIVLGRVPNPDEAGRVPRVAVSLGLVLTLVSLGMLIAFIHHVARSIQASEVVRRACQLALESVRSLYPDQLGEEEREEPAAPPDLKRPVVVRAADSGYVQAVDVECLFAFADEHDTVICLRVQPGDFVTIGDVVIEATRSGDWPDDWPELARSWLVIRHERSPEQDARYSVGQLAEIAVRALSPSINDPNTAIECIDQLGAILVEVVARRIPSEARMSNGRLRAWVPRADFPAIADAAIPNLRHYSREHPSVWKRLEVMLARVEQRAQRPQDLSWLRGQRQALVRGGGDVG